MPETRPGAARARTLPCRDEGSSGPRAASGACWDGRDRRGIAAACARPLAWPAQKTGRRLIRSTRCTAAAQQVNADLKTLTAHFTETTTSSLLTRPLVSRGTLAVERPSRVVLRYDEPEARVVLIDGDTMTMSWPAERQAGRPTSAPRRAGSRNISSTARRPSCAAASRSTSRRRRSSRHLSRDDGAEAEADSGRAVAARSVGRPVVACCWSAMQMTFPNGDTEADDVRRRRAERAARSGASSR